MKRVVLTTVLLTCLVAPAFCQTGRPALVVGFMRSMFQHVNMNDAEAVIKSWGQIIARENGITAGTETRIITSEEELIRDMQAGAVDAVGMNVLEYEALSRTVPLGPVFLNSIRGGFAENFVLLAHAKGPVSSLRDLRGRRLLINDSPRTAIIAMWLDLELIDHGLPETARLVGRVDRKATPADTILPVFFQQAEACITTREAFDVMAELNPQIGRQLKVLLISPPVATTMLAFRRDFASEYRDVIMRVLENLDATPAGRQILTIFQSDGLREMPLTTIAPTLELIERHRRLVQ